MLTNPKQATVQAATSARTIMHDFAIATGLSGTSCEPRRYLWTDAFAVCNFLELYRQTNEDSYLDIARKLVDEVHFVLGRYSEQDSRSGWISGLDERAGYDHPTVGGLRIGKELVERQADEFFDSDLEWSRDGQYLHYLTKWMQALTRIAVVTGENDYQRWALELARAAHAAFAYPIEAGKPGRMYWKMSVDLSRPLVTGMGYHDPLDALITYMELRAHNGRYGSLFCDITLDSEIADCQAMCAGKVWATDDPLGTGSLLVDTFRLAQIKTEFDIAGPVNLAALLVDCEAGLEAFVSSDILNHPAEHRLAFRELGLATGLHALARLRRLIEQYPRKLSLALGDRTRLERLAMFSYLSNVIERFWCQAASQQSANWHDHVDINSVMLATSLAPDGYLLVSAGKKRTPTQ